MRAIHWLLLDNLISGWMYSANMAQSEADEALEWAESHGFVRDGQITDEGRGHFLTHQHAKPVA